MKFTEKELTEAQRSELLASLFYAYKEDNGFVYDEDGDRRSNLEKLKTLEDFIKCYGAQQHDKGYSSGQYNIRKAFKQLLNLDEPRA